MKVLHTSDWHIGQVFYNYDRSDEHLFFFEWLTRVVEEHQPDVMVVCGDVFHTATPSIASQKLYIEAIIKIHEAAPNMAIVVTAGNHDSGSRIEVDKLLWDSFNVTTIGNVARDEKELNKHIIPIGCPAKGYVVAIPYCYPQNFPAFEEGVQKEEKQIAFFKRLLDEVKGMNKQGVPVVMTAHCTVIGSNPGKQELTVGGLDSINVSELGNDFDYLALGHIHFPQNVGEKARYCGTPLPISFNEDYKHSVTIVEIEKSGAPLNKTIIEAPVKRNVVTLPEDAMEFDEALEALRNFPDNEEAYIRLHVKTKQYGGADWSEKAINTVKDKKCHYCCLLTEVSKAIQTENRTTFNNEEFRQMSPLDIAKLYWKESINEEMDEELEKLMASVVKEVMGE